MRRVLVICVALALLLCGCGQKREDKEILAFPVYGQSHALAESAERVSDNNELQSYGGRILTQNLDTKFGYFADNKFSLPYLSSLIFSQPCSVDMERISLLIDSSNPSKSCCTLFSHDTITLA